MKNKKEEISKALAVVQKEENKYQLQSNEFSRGIYSCSPMARRLIAFCISNAYQDTLFLSIIQQENDERKLRNISMPCMTSDFTISQFFERMGMTRGEIQTGLVRNAVDECSHLTIKVENTAKAFHANPWFIDSYVNFETGKISMTFHPVIFKALTEWYEKNKGYSALKLDILGKLRSFYAMRYYEIAISERGNEGKNGNPAKTWFFQFTIQEIRTMFEIKPKEYKDRIDNFTTFVVTSPIRELNEKNTDFQIEVVKIKTGRQTVGFRFICRATATTVLKIEKSANYEDKKALAETNDINSEVEFLSKKYPKRFNKILEEVKKQQTLPGLPRFEALDKQEAARRLKELLEEEKNKKSQK